METLDVNCTFEISKLLKNELEKCLLVNSQWKFIFHDNFNALKPQQSQDQIVSNLFKKLQLGVYYDISKTLYIYKTIKSNIPKSDDRKIHRSFILKLAIDKPSINYYPLYMKRIVENDLSLLKLS
mgnify:CR=1 FL=1